MDIKSISTRMATEDDAHLPAYDHTKLSAVNTCPTYGIIRYSHHKKMPGSYRQMALEAGTASHEGFAAVRMYQYLFHTETFKHHTANAQYQGVKLFGKERYQAMLDTLSDGATDRTNCINFVVEAVELCGFYDDISDNKRTLSNITESLISYIDAYDMKRYPIWIRDKDDPKTDIGIEIAFDIVVSITLEEPHVAWEPSYEFRFTGKLDGLHMDKGDLIIQENKSGSRLDDAWLSQWVLSHQITGYCVASATFTGLPCTKAMVMGMKLPIGRVPAEGIRTEKVPRGHMLVTKWAEWFLHSTLIERKYIDNILEAPMYTHSCNRYFSSCSFLPFCAADNKEEKELILSELEIDEWSPLHE
tara:strand:- start:228 stop:1304 length:1077 start_codon:yes stop_codon:yes gene_type:complete